MTLPIVILTDLTNQVSFNFESRHYTLRPMLLHDVPILLLKPFSSHSLAFLLYLTHRVTGDAVLQYYCQHRLLLSRHFGLCQRNDIMSVKLQEIHGGRCWNLEVSAVRAVL